MSEETEEGTLGLVETVADLASRITAIEDKLTGLATQVQASSVVRPAEPVGEE